MSSDIDAVLAELSTLEVSQLDGWIPSHRQWIDAQLFERLRVIYAEGDALVSQPALADKMTRFALLLADARNDSPLLPALAAWARGNWASLHDPNLAIEMYQHALPALSQRDDALGIARIHGSLSRLYTIKGRFKEAEAERELALPELLRQFPTRPVLLLRLMRNYGELLHYQGRFDEALRAHDAVIALAEEKGFPTIAIDARNNRALTLGMLGRLNEVEHEYLEDRDHAERHGLLLEVAWLDMNLGDFYTACGRPAEAFRRLHAAESAFTQLGNELEAGTCRWLQGVLLQKIGAHDAALRYLNEALAAFEARDMRTEVAKLRLRVAELYRLRGEFQSAAEALQRAENSAHVLGDTSIVVAVQLEHARLWLDQGEPQQTLRQSKQILGQTITQYDQAQVELLTAQAHEMLGEISIAAAGFQSVLAFAVSQQEIWLQQQALLGLGRALSQSHPEHAVRHVRAAAALAEEMRSTLTVEELKSALHAGSEAAYEDLMALAIANNQPHEAMASVWRAKSSAFVELVEQRRRDAGLRAGDLQNDASRDEIGRVRQQLATLHWALVQENASVSAGDLAAQAQQHIRQLESRLLALRRKRASPPLLKSNDFDVSPASLFQSVESTLSSMDVDGLLEFARCRDRVHGFFADRAGRFHSVDLMAVRELARLLTRLRLKFAGALSLTAAQREQLANAMGEECLPLLAEMGERLIAPLLAHMPSAAEGHTLAIAPCDPLFALPFAALRVGDAFLADRFQIVMIQSGALFGMQNGAQHGDASPPVVIAASADAIVHVRAEAMQVAAILPQSRTFVDQPALDALSHMRPSPSVIHIAAHTLQQEDVPLLGGLKLTDEVLSVERCYDLRLTETLLVTLSGCNTAGGLASGGQLLSLQQALFVAGAKNVLCSLHAVPDDAAVTWMGAFYDHFVVHQNVAQAVQLAQQAMRSQPAMNHPALWAAFATWRR